MGATEEEKDRVSMEKFGCKFSELKDPQDRMSVGGTIGGRTTGPQQAEHMRNPSDNPEEHGTHGASEQEKDEVSMEKFGCKFSELKDPQDRMSVGGTIGGRMRAAALRTHGEGEGQEQEQEADVGGGGEAVAEGEGVENVE
ncbi:hypothetical protein HYH02_009422 [Chlamydomonas schloesseri]|uniref:Uncharacterized protein n=1 Tax=Chlamydomonas schloesseri TaxID=2026947 RepID=A0A835W9X8_9CHLO|nr:hypothetical protein HYH02_009422 [Chlamydomonas schloesseri]|eukprot:KAG2443006.1 hypothetical protein HYH02_009422 [Chlamydomonas schloesseri]